jgi:uncharacterized protein YkwD
MSSKRAVRVAATLAALAAAALLVGSALASGSSERSLTTLNRQVLASINHLRAAHGLVRLRESPALDRSARRHSLEMGRLGYFSHSSAAGIQFWQRIRDSYSAHGYSYWAVGENLGWASPSLSAAGTTRMWLADPAHRENLLAAQWRQIGISAVGLASAPGVYGRRRVTIITADFGVRH